MRRGIVWWLIQSGAIRSALSRMSRACCWWPRRAWARARSARCRARDANGNDGVLGILLAKDLLPLILQGEQPNFNIKDLLRPATFVPESKRLNVLLREFRANHNHMAVVIDEYGGVAGLVTIEDVL